MADQLTQMQYPSGRTVDYVPDAAGRITTVKNDATQLAYATVGYTPAGGIQTLTMPKITETLSWNDRQQVYGLVAGPAGTSLLTLGLYPCAGNAYGCSTGNTGNLQSETVGIPGLSLTQTLTYDPLSRLSAAGEGSGSWSQGYGYDQWGNRWVPSSSGYTLSPLTPTVQTNYNSANNQLLLQAGNDTAGNQTADGGYTSAFDVAGRMVTNTVNSGVTTYVYDGDGQRVMKQNWLGTTTYVYDAQGNLASELTAPAAGAVLPSGQTNACGTLTCYVTVDHLGSTRMVTDSNGNVMRRYDYLPSGEEIPMGTGGRTAGMGYQFNPSVYTLTGGQDGFNPKFTGQVRDWESGLDYFNARYYSPAQGRFVAPDPDNAGADLANSQTWNGYAYVGNNPLSWTDPSGLGFFDFLDNLIHDVLDLFSGGLWGIFTSAVEGGSPGPGSVLGGLPDLGGLTACGGPLGSCGGFGSGPWSENAGLGDVRNPGQFVSDVLQVAPGALPAQIADYNGALVYLERDPGMARIIKQLRRSRRVYTVSFTQFVINGDNYLNGHVNWAPRGSALSVGGGCNSPALLLGHEFAHAYEDDLYPYWFARERGVPAGDYDTQVEKWAITGPEAHAARTLGEPVRHTHHVANERDAMYQEPNSTSRTCR